MGLEKMQHNDFENTNEVWTWVDHEDGYHFEKVTLNNMIGGDTDSSMFSLENVVDPDTPEDDVVEVADLIGELTNESFPDFCEFAFNCPKERRDIIQTDREVVSDKSLFLTKKRYIMHIVNNEGVSVDKLKIMGVEIKKSDTPKAVKDYLLELVNLILDGNEEDALREKISEFKLDFRTRPLKEIGRPISCKGLYKYQKMYEMDESMKGFPYQVRAAMFYNSMRSKLDKEIMPTDKISVIYIKHPDTKYVALPIDQNQTPSFMKNIVVDYDTLWDKANSKITAYLSAIGYDFKSKKAAKKKELFGF